RDRGGAAAEAGGARRVGEMLRRGQGEREWRRRVRQLAGDIGEPGPRNMSSRVALASALHGVRAAAWRAPKEDGGVEHAHPLVTEHVAEFGWADQRGQQRHLGNLPGINLRYRAPKINRARPWRRRSGTG